MLAPLNLTMILVCHHGLFPKAKCNAARALNVLHKTLTIKEDIVASLFIFSESLLYSSTQYKSY